jgi:hypothetical protein
MNQAYSPSRESVEIPGTPIRASRIGLGTWAMGGWMWGGTDSLESIATIRATAGVAGWSLDRVTLAAIDRILNETITDPIGPEFMAPLDRS